MSNENNHHRSLDFGSSGEPPDNAEENNTPHGGNRGARRKSKVGWLSTKGYVWEPSASIALTSDEDGALRWLYETRRIPIDQYVRRPVEWRDFTRAWNAATGRRDTPQDVIRYMVNQRKQGRWPRLGTRHKRLADIRLPLTSDQWEAFDRVYVEMNVASDNFMFDAKLAKEFRKRLYAIARFDLGELELVGGLLARRKAGLLPTLTNPQKRKSRRGFFNDIDSVSI